MFSFPYRLIFTQILVLQLSGAKEWRHCRTKRSASCTTYEDADLDDLACETVVLEPGDALFLPRGVVHGAVAVDAASVHLTIGLGGHRCEARRQLQDVVCMTVADHGGTACPAGTFNEGSGTYDASSCDGSCDYLGDCNSACNTCTGCESCSDRDEDVCAADGAVLLGCGGSSAGTCVPAPRLYLRLCQRVSATTKRTPTAARRFPGVKLRGVSSAAGRARTGSYRSSAAPLGPRRFRRSYQRRHLRLRRQRQLRRRPRPYPLPRAARRPSFAGTTWRLGSTTTI